MSLKNEFVESGLIHEKFGGKKKDGKDHKTDEPPPKLDDTKDQIIPEPEPDESEDGDQEGGDTPEAPEYDMGDIAALKSGLDVASWALGKLMGPEVDVKLSTEPEMGEPEVEHRTEESAIDDPPPEQDPSNAGPVDVPADSSIDKKQILIEMSAKIDEFKQVVEGWLK